MKNVISNSAWNLKRPPPGSNKPKQATKKIWRATISFLVSVWKFVLVPSVRVFRRQEDGLEQWRRLEFNKPLPKGDFYGEEK